MLLLKDVNQPRLKPALGQQVVATKPEASTPAQTKQGHLAGAKTNQNGLELHRITPASDQASTSTQPKAANHLSYTNPVAGDAVKQPRLKPAQGQPVKAAGNA